MHTPAQSVSASVIIGMAIHTHLHNKTDKYTNPPKQFCKTEMGTRTKGEHTIS